MPKKMKDFVLQEGVPFDMPYLLFIAYISSDVTVVDNPYDCMTLIWQHKNSLWYNKALSCSPNTSYMYWFWLYFLCKIFVFS